jgi:hypothetical protein
MRTIYLPALGLHVTLAAYLQAVRMAKANPEMTFKTGFTTWWPTTGAEVMEQFHEGLMERINQAIPYIQRGGKKRSRD